MLIAPLFSSVCTPGVWVQVLSGGQPVRKEDVWSGCSLCRFKCAGFWQVLASKACGIAEGDVNRQLAICIVSP